MNILLIGNSYSVDATRYLHRIARADKVDITTACIYIGGCPLERHFRNMHSEKDAYNLFMNGEECGFFVSLKEALVNRSWDVITLQQASFESFDFKNYEPYLTVLSEYIRTLCPNAKIYIHQTWCDNVDSPRLEGFGFSDSKGMLAEIIKAYDKACKEIKADGIIRSGELIYSLYENGLNPVWRDHGHVSYGIGRLAVGLLWYKTLTGNDIMKNTFCDTDEPVSEKELEIIKKCVNSI
ncbi:MAG: DUF4886 domain-containing protein [Ruminococcaceae bacterium]|nr:DUF4886 domain-containing protein [Oscillospiraceae bacterium]